MMPSFLPYPRLKVRKFADSLHPCAGNRYLTVRDGESYQTITSRMYLPLDMQTDFDRQVGNQQIVPLMFYRQQISVFLPALKHNFQNMKPSLLFF